MKKSQGISLISLIVTIVVIIILAGMAIYNGISDNVDQTANTMDYNEIFEVSEAVAQRALFNKLNSTSYGLIGETSITGFKVDMIEYSGDEEVKIERTLKTSDGWYLVDEDDAEKLNLEKIRREYYVNYKTNEVITKVPILYESKKYSSASDLKDALGGGSVVISANRYDEEKGVNKPYVVSGMIPVKLSGDAWIVTNVDDVNWYDYAPENNNKGNLWANVMLLDEIEISGMTNSEVRNASLTALENKEVTKEGSMYVWIPRYSRGTNGDIVFSKLTEDYYPDETAEGNVLKAFEDNGVELTGIWISKYDAGYVER